jgi:hypothetical protein
VATAALLTALVPAAASAQAQKFTAKGADGSNVTVTIYVNATGGNGGKGGDARGPGGQAGAGGPGGNAVVNIVRGDTLPKSEPTVPDGSKITFTTRENRDLEGNDILLAGSRIGERNVTLEGCQNLCAKLENCVAYAYDKVRAGGVCYPKKSFGALNLDVTSSVGVRTPNRMPSLIEGDYRWEPYGGRRFRGSVSNVSWSPSADMCQSSCAGALNCVAYSYDKNGSGQNCSFFRLIDGWDKDPGFVSSAKTQSPQTPPSQQVRGGSSGSFD